MILLINRFFPLLTADCLPRRYAKLIKQMGTHGVSVLPGLMTQEKDLKGLKVVILTAMIYYSDRLQNRNIGKKCMR